MIRMFSSLVVGLALVWAPARVLACECVPIPIYKTSPKDGAVDVALNQAVMLEGVYERGSITLEDASGAPVEFTLNEGPWPGCPGYSVDVLPKAPLKPNTRYTLRVKPMYPDALPGSPDAISFTTGTRMLPDDEQLVTPEASASVLKDGPLSMCGGATVYMCLGIDADDTDDVELIARRGAEILLRTTTLVQNDGLYGLQQVPDCVELRRRSRTGRRSEPLAICGDALGVRAHRESDSAQQVVMCRGGVIGRPAAEPTKPSEPDAGAPDAGESATLSNPDSGAAPDAAAPPAAPSQHKAHGCTTSAIGAQPSYASLWLLLMALFVRRTKPAKR